MSKNQWRCLFFTVLLLKISIFVSVSALNSEGLALLSWRSSSDSNSSSYYSLFSSWNSNDPNPCKWDFITCSRDGFVAEINIKSIKLLSTFPTQFLSMTFLTKLIISGANLTGNIPPEIGNLTDLTVLDLSSNSLTGKIPPQIGKLKKLQMLSLSSNFLDGKIPPEIGNCSEIRQLGLVDNRFSGQIPASFGALWNLEVLRVGGNMAIQGRIPAEISNCKGLIYLGLADTGISGPIPASFGELKKLQTLSVYTANLAGEIPPEIGNCSELVNLYLYENQLSGKIPAEMGKLRKLKNVLLWQNNLVGTLPGLLGNCSSLTVLDLSLNSLRGEIPQSFANLINLNEFLLSDNNVAGKIPSFISNISGLVQLELDNNQFSGEIPAEIGKLSELTLFFAWQNQIQGKIPPELGNCEKLQALDLSHNFLTGIIPTPLFHLKNLTKLLLLSNSLSGSIPREIGNCTGLIRLRLGLNRLSGEIPREIGSLRNLSFLELSENRISGEIPQEIGNCTELEMVDLHENRLQGTIPTSLQFLVGLHVLDLSMNRISGSLPEILGKLTSVNKLLLNGNYLSGSIPQSLGFCSDLQLLDMSNNRISGSIPAEMGNLQALDIALNLSWNFLSGPVPEQFSKLSKVAYLDLSHNMLTGSLNILGLLENLVSLNVSYNNFSGYLPDTKLFRELPKSVLNGNRDLCTDGDECFAKITDTQLAKNHRTKSSKLVNGFLFGITAIILISGVILIIRAKKMAAKTDIEEQEGWDWEFTPFQKLNFCVEDVVKSLADSNVIGKGCSGVVYRVETRIGQVIAVKKLWPAKNDDYYSDRDMFTAEIRTLGSIRHRNIVRLLGCCSNRSNRLLMFDYMANGSLAELLHEKRVFLDWDCRYKIILGAAEGLAYLHHDCVPPIVHRDIKANNILISSQFDAYIADFGLAKLVDSSENSKFTNSVAGSYGYIAPECGYRMKITEKSDVYSYGVVLLEILTGMQPIDPRIPNGAHIVNWVREKSQKTNGEAIEILDEKLRCWPDSQIKEMFQAVGMALLCVNSCPEERPTMKDVAALLKEIWHEAEDHAKADLLGKGSQTNSKAAAHCNSFSKSSEPLIRSPSLFYSSTSSRLEFH